MLDFVRKQFLWDAWERGLDSEIASSGRFDLKAVQDLAVYDHLRDVRGKTIAEIGGGSSRLLGALAAANTCFNVEKFEGKDGGPVGEIRIPNVRNVPVFLGEYSTLLAPQFFDVVFSISVVEHVANEEIDDFFQDGLRILKSGGLWLHAIDLYVGDAPHEKQNARYEIYRSWFGERRLRPLGPIYDRPLRFACDMASNPDDVMYQRGKSAPTLIARRKVAQNVSLILAGRKE